MLQLGLIDLKCFQITNFGKTGLKFTPLLQIVFILFLKTLIKVIWDVLVQDGKDTELANTFQLLVFQVTNNQ
jgi:hypothetical protein